MKNQTTGDMLHPDQSCCDDRARRSRWLLVFVVAAVLIGVGTSTPLFAQGGDTDSSAEVSVDPSAVTADEVNEIASELWCPLCSGVRLDSCELKACDQMKDEIAIKLAAGDGLNEIRTYFVDQYGPQVLGEPPREGFNLLAWVLPFLVLIGGGVFLITRGRKIFRNDVGAEAVPVPANNEPGAVESPSQDPYARRLEEELKQYD